MAAESGNNYAMKWKTPEERRAAFDRLCAHLKSGLSLQAFPDADEDTIKRYLADFPDDFGRVKYDEALREGRRLWEMIGMNGTLGKTKGFNAPSWIFTMKARFKWKDNITVAADPDNPLIPPSAPAQTPEEAAAAYSDLMKRVGKQDE